MNTLRDKINSEVKEITSFHSPSLNRINQSIDSIQSIAEDFAAKFAIWWLKSPHPLNESGANKAISDFRDNFYSPNIKEGENKNS